MLKNKTLSLSRIINVMEKFTSELIKSIATAGEDYHVEFKKNVPEKVRELSQACLKQLNIT